MATNDADELVPFQNVTLMSSTGSALFCEVAGKRVWLPRRHISGKLYCIGDRATLLIRRWVACDRRLLRPPRLCRVSVLAPSMARRRHAAQLHLVR